jgi:hypothetical protein
LNIFIDILKYLLLKIQVRMFVLIKYTIIFRIIFVSFFFK